MSVDEWPRMNLPVYKTPTGKIRPIGGKHAESWPHPRQARTDDGALWVERPMPHESDWGITFHAYRRPRTPVGMFVRHYAEGRASGFPWWPVVFFSAKWAARMALRIPYPETTTITCVDCDISMPESEWPAHYDGVHPPPENPLRWEGDDS